MQTDERIARVALQWLSASLSPRRGSGMQIAATGFRLQCLHVVRKGRYVMHRADRAYTRCVYSYYPIPILARGEHETSVRVNALGRVRLPSAT